MSKTKVLSAFERGIVVGARRTGLCQELQHCWVFHAHVRPPKGRPANLTTVGSIGVNMGHHSCGTQC